MKKNGEQTVTPWDVHADSTEGKIDYGKLIRQFGCQELSLKTAEKYRLEHVFFRRGIVFAHRDLDLLMEHVEKKGSIYLYTGRGPSSRSMHLGHAVPFMLCKYLQDRFGCKIVIQLTDDEKYIWKNITLEEAAKYSMENAKDILAFGFDPELTFLFRNTEYAHRFFETTLKIEKNISLKDYMKVFGFSDTCKVGQISFPARQMSPCFPSSFPDLIGENSMCLIPCSIDQDPYFRLTRDVSGKVGGHKPATLYTYFLPALQGPGSKMSASLESSAIYLDDTPAAVGKKILKYAFSGGRDTKEEHEKLGGNTEVDVAFQYLRFFLDDDQLLQEYKTGYEQGRILSGEMKKKCIDTLQKVLQDHQGRRAMVTDELLSRYFSPPSRTVPENNGNA